MHVRSDENTEMITLFFIIQGKVILEIFALCIEQAVHPHFPVQVSVLSVIVKLMS